MCNYGISFEKYKTNLVPSFLPALSGSTCIISLANHYNTSVDAAIVQRLWRDYQVECLKECGGEFAESVVLIFEFCCVHSWLGKQTNLFFNILSSAPKK